MSEDNLGTFLVSFQGAQMTCRTLDDAIAFRAATRILANEAACDDSSGRIFRIADVLISYGQLSAADRLNLIASRRRAMQFLVGIEGYSPPKHLL